MIFFTCRRTAGGTFQGRAGVQDEKILDQDDECAVHDRHAAVRVYAGICSQRSGGHWHRKYNGNFNDGNRFRFRKSVVRKCRIHSNQYICDDGNGHKSEISDDVNDSRTDGCRR